MHTCVAALGSRSKTARVWFSHFCPPFTLKFPHCQAASPACIQSCTRTSTAAVAVRMQLQSAQLTSNRWLYLNVKLQYTAGYGCPQLLGEAALGRDVSRCTHLTAHHKLECVVVVVFVVDLVPLSRIVSKAFFHAHLCYGATQILPYCCVISSMLQQGRPCIGTQWCISHVMSGTRSATLRAHSEASLQLLELLEDAVPDPDVVLIVAPSLCRILQNAPGPALAALDKHDAITILAYIVKKQQQLDQIKVGQAN